MNEPDSQTSQTAERAHINGNFANVPVRIQNVLRQARSEIRELQNEIEETLAMIQHAENEADSARQMAVAEEAGKAGQPVE